MCKLSILFVLCFLCKSLSAQKYFDKKSRDAKVTSLLKKYKGKEIGFFSNSEYKQDVGSLNLFLIKDKSSKLWGVMKSTELGGNNFEYFVPPIYDSIGDLIDDSDFVIFKKEDKYGVASLIWEKEGMKIDCDFDEVKFVEKEGRNYTLVRKKSKWGLYQTEYCFLSAPCIYKSVDEVPKYRVSTYDYQTFNRYKNKFNLKGYRPDGNGDGVFYGCNSNGKWGLFQIDRNIVPMKYDRIEPMSFNAPFLIVYNENKAGVYSNPFGNCRMTVPCQYEELKRFTSNGYFYCAVRKGKKWAILDWYTGEETTEYRWDSYKELRVPRNSKSKFYEY